MQAERPSVHPHVRVITDLAWASALLTSIRSGLLPRLIADGPLPDPATTLGLDTGVTEGVLRVLEAHGWVERTPGGWSATPAIRDDGNGAFGLQRLVGIFDHLPSSLDDGSVVHRREVRHDAAVVRALAGLVEPAAAALARVLEPFHGVILDVGCGAAPWGLAMLQRSPRATLIGLDRTEVLTAAVSLASALGLSSRLQLCEGSFWELDWPRADRVVIANVVHLLDDTEAEALVHRAAAALRPEGSLVVVDALPPEGTWSPELAGYALGLRLREPHGTVHPLARIQGWMQTAGLAPERVVDLSNPALQGLGAVIGAR